MNAALMGGRGNVEEHRFERPTGVTYGVALRSYDPKTAEWAIWWIDSRLPHGDMDPPMKGRFKDGIGTFYSDSTLDGKPIKVRFIWSGEATGKPHWEQAYSEDGGKTWAVNWIMDFEPRITSRRMSLTSTRSVFGAAMKVAAPARQLTVSFAFLAGGCSFGQSLSSRCQRTPAGASISILPRASATQLRQLAACQVHALFEVVQQRSCDRARRA